MNSPALKRMLPGVALLALAVFAWLQAGTIEGAAGDAMGLGPALWPRIACVLLGISSLCSIALGMASARPSARQDEQAEEPADGLPAVPETQPWLVWIAVVATGLFAAALDQVGFAFDASLYAMALLVIGGMRRWWLVPIYGIVLALVFTLIFMKVVYVALPLGTGPFRALSLLVLRLLGIH
ncbi:MAG TPA: tripartite tricarboxylate transporter TctB family protein [Burkholderiaceae bacterium]|nr:tripartite tricarboxylate transporter TctB family protein [Burkholderiaceae bacterium]